MSGPTLFTLADRCEQDASNAMWYALRAAGYRRNALDAPRQAKTFRRCARDCERHVVALASRLQVRLQLLADQGVYA